jgi:hypothetical protein
VSKDKERDAIVNAIIGDIDILATIDDDEEIEPLTGEELAEFEAYHGANPYPITPEQDERMRGFVERLRQWFIYQMAMKERGLPAYDFTEWDNLAVKPAVPEE